MDLDYSINYMKKEIDEHNNELNRIERQIADYKMKIQESEIFIKDLQKELSKNEFSSNSKSNKDEQYIKKENQNIISLKKDISEMNDKKKSLNSKLDKMKRVLDELSNRADDNIQKEKYDTLYNTYLKYMDNVNASLSNYEKVLKDNLLVNPDRVRADFIGLQSSINKNLDKIGDVLKEYNKQD